MNAPSIADFMMSAVVLPKRRLLRIAELEAKKARENKSRFLRLVSDCAIELVGKARLIWRRR